MKEEDLVLNKLYFVQGEGNTFQQLLKIDNSTAYFNLIGQENISKILRPVPQYLINQKIKTLESQLNYLKWFGSGKEIPKFSSSEDFIKASREQMNTLIGVEVIISYFENESEIESEGTDLIEGILLECLDNGFKIELKDNTIVLPYETFRHIGTTLYLESKF